MEWLFRLLSRLPLPLLHGMGAALGIVVYLASPKYRKRLKANAAQAGYQGIHWAAAREAGKMVLELPYLWLRHEGATAASQCKLNGFEHFQAAMNAGRGIIILTPHLGCFELCAQVPALYTPMTALYRAHKKAAMRGVIEKFRTRKNLATVPADLSGVRDLLRTLKKGGTTGLLPDQVPAPNEGEKGSVIALWFGKPAMTMTFPAKLVHMSGATVLLLWTRRLPKGAGYEIYIAPFDEALSRDAAEAATQINRAMEGLIRQCPTQYLWAYDRYKGVSSGIL